MSVTDLPILGMLRTKMQWHQTRQKLLAENVANADTPGFKPRDLAQPKFGKSAEGLAQPEGAAGFGGLARTSAGHFAIAGGDAASDPRRFKGFEITPNGNGVNLEEEMLKAGENQGSYALAASLYQKSLETLKIAIGKR